MNALIKLSEEARAQLQQATAMPDLDYHLLVLETGCQCLDDLVRPVGTVSQDAREKYRDHLSAIGWWSWYEMQWRSMEIRVAAEWYGPESMVPQQTDAWRRERLLTEARTMRYTYHYARAFDTWMKLLEDKKALILPAIPTQPEHQIDHVHSH